MSLLWNVTWWPYPITSIQLFSGWWNFSFFVCLLCSVPCLPSASRDSFPSFFLHIYFHIAKPTKSTLNIYRSRKFIHKFIFFGCLQFYYYIILSETILMLLYILTDIKALLNWNPYSSFFSVFLFSLEEFLLLWLAGTRLKVMVVELRYESRYWVE